ncbi:hypothetical protein H0W91_03950 [Patescibacteria group bacterium]|nr:hypothetical protein [Patescibacteria group bacterium]
MENFDSSQYRENLAKEVKQESDKNKRQDILEQAKGTEEYQAARTETIASRRQKIEEQKAIEEQREKLRGGESKEILLGGAEAFTTEVLEKYPQVSEDGKLNYYFSGSLGVMILLKGGRFEILDESKIPEIVPIQEKDVPPKAVKYLEGFVRKIGDLDFVGTELYAKQKKAVQDSYGKVPNEEYSRKRKQFLFKGGGGPQMAELSETAKKALKTRENQSGVMCDPLESVTPHRVARVIIGGREVYIPEPRMMLAYKTVHLGQTFENAGKTDKFVSDFNAMLKGMEAIYSREELLQATHETIFAYSPNSPNNTFVPYHNPKFRGDLKKFYNESLALDVDAEYLTQLQYGKERSVGVLKVLHNFQSPEAKQAIIDFFNQHQEQIDKWSVNSTSPHNREVIADFLISRPDLFDDFKTHVQGDLTRESIVEGLKTHVWAFDKYGKKMLDKSSLEMQPSSSTTMDILMKINEKNIERELQDVGELLEFGMGEFQLDRMLDSKFASDTETRQRLFDGLKSARAILGDQEFEQFTRILYMAVSNSNYYDSKSNSFVDIKEEERAESVASIFEQSGVEYKRS